MRMKKIKKYLRASLMIIKSVTFNNKVDYFVENLELKKELVKLRHSQYKVTFHKIGKYIR